MDLKFTTSPEEDALLQQLSDKAMSGHGQEKQPDLETFTDGYLHAYLDIGLKAVIQTKREEVKKLIEMADPTTLEAVKVAVDAVVQKK